MHANVYLPGFWNLGFCSLKAFISFPEWNASTLHPVPCDSLREACFVWNWILILCLCPASKAAKLVWLFSRVLLPFHFPLTRRLKFHSEHRRRSFDFPHKHFDHWSSRACGEVKHPACTLGQLKRGPCQPTLKKIKPIGIKGLLQFGVLATFLCKVVCPKLCTFISVERHSCTLDITPPRYQSMYSQSERNFGNIKKKKIKSAYRIYSELYCKLSSCCPVNVSMCRCCPQIKEIKWADVGGWTGQGGSLLGTKR